MRLLLLATLALPLVLCGCTASPTATDALAPASSSRVELASTAGSCPIRATPTVVRYRSRQADRTQHSVQLLNTTSVGPTLDGCAPALPLAGVVTLRYRVAGG